MTTDSKKLKINRHLFNKGTDELTGYCGHLFQGVRLPICVGSKALDEQQTKYLFQ